MAEAFVSDARPSDLHNLEDECRREVSQRRSAYAKLVRDNRMQQNQADYRIMQMERLVTLLQALQQPGMRLLIDVTPTHAVSMTPAMLELWLNEPEAFIAKAKLDASKKPVAEIAA
jgi:hypothetical protein